MDKLLDDKNPLEQFNIYKIPTHSEVVEAMKKGPFLGRCRLCKKKISVLTLEEFKDHKCNG